MKSLNASKMPQKKLSLKSTFFAESHLFSFLCFWFTLDPILSSNTVVYLCLLLQFFWTCTNNGYPYILLHTVSSQLFLAIFFFSLLAQNS